MATTKTQRHPIQPLAKDEHDTLRFKENRIVSDLLDYATERGFGLNEIACRRHYTKEDRQQLAQLIGYSLSGYSELSSYVDDEAYGAATLMAENPEMDERDARIADLEGRLKTVREQLSEGVGTLYGKHPSDFTES